MVDFDGGCCKWEEYEVNNSNANIKEILIVKKNFLCSQTTLTPSTNCSRQPNQYGHHQKWNPLWNEGYFQLKWAIKALLILKRIGIILIQAMLQLNFC
jgi:hypothetical protein